MTSNREQFDWDHRIKFLLRDSFEPQTFQNYKKTVLRSIRNASRFIEAIHEPIPTIDTIKTVHAISFGQVYTNAGEFRAFEQEISIGRDGGRGAYYSQIGEELELLATQMNALLEASSSLKDKAKAISFYHARYVKIHPFLDGNGRSARIILDMQVENLLGKTRRIDFSHEEYIRGLGQAFSKGDLTYLTKTMTGVELDKGNEKVSFSLKLKPIVILRNVGAEKVLKIPCGEDVELAQEVEIADITERLKMAVIKGQGISLGLKESTRTSPAVLDLGAPKAKVPVLSRQLQVSRKKDGLNR